MKRMLLRKKRRTWKEMSFEERVAKAYYKLPKYLRAFVSRRDRKQAIIATAAALSKGDFDVIDKSTGKRPDISYVLYKGLKDRLPTNYETKQVMFRRFRLEEPALFAKYNSYMFRQGFRSTAYFMEHAEVTSVGTNKYKNDIIQAYLEIPVNMMGTARIRKQTAVYHGLTITIHGSGSKRLEEGEMNVELT